MDSPEVNDGSDVWKNQHTWSIQSWKLYSFSGVHVLETVSGLVLHMFVDKKYPLSVNLIERMLHHQQEICHGSVGNKLTTAVSPTASIGFVFLLLLDVALAAAHSQVLILKLTCEDLSRNLKLTGSNSSLGEDFPTGKDNVIVSAGRAKVIPAGRTILVLVVLCLLRVDSIVS
ncbi:hypothetical protein Tco_0842414 [Tanacetum coccineum]|uniref:Uncharacterized protein n=1 Tax=Tanacetum coccineum TaxID=301880 RepID=A0ABQ5B1E3_9ASTR